MDMPRILYGTAWKGADTARLVQVALRAGFRGIDTACQPRHYDEPGVGVGVAAAVEAGLVRCETLWQQSKFTAQRTLEVWRAMEHIADSGGTKRLGISNCYSSTQLGSLYRAARLRPAVLQNRFHAATNHDLEIRRFCRAHGITYQSFWTLTANPQLLAHRTIATLAAHYGRTPAQVFFRALTQIGIVPLTGTRDEAHMREDLAIVEFDLADDELEAVSRLIGEIA